jgi:hypothetical protein
MADGLSGLAGLFGGASSALNRYLAYRERMEQEAALQAYRTEQLGIERERGAQEAAYQQGQLSLAEQRAEDERIAQTRDAIIEGLRSMDIAVIDPMAITERLRAVSQAREAQAKAPPVTDMRRDIGGALQRGADVARTTTEQQRFMDVLGREGAAARARIGERPAATEPIVVDGRHVATAFSKQAPVTRQEIVSTSFRPDQRAVEVLRAMTALERARTTAYSSIMRDYAKIMADDRWGMYSPAEKQNIIRRAQGEATLALGGMPVDEEFQALLREQLEREFGVDISTIQPASMSATPRAGVRPGDRRGTELNPPTEGVRVGGRPGLAERLKLNLRRNR